MAEFQITSPDGRQFRVTAPEGASQDDVLARVRAHTGQDASRETSGQQPSSWMDFLKSIPTGVMRGLAGTAAMSGQAEASLTGMEGVAGPAESEKLVERGLGRRGVELHEPTGRAGQYGASIGRALGDPTTYLGPGGLARKALTGVTGAVGAELGGQLTKDSTTGRVIGGLAGGLAPGGVEAAYRYGRAPVTRLRPGERDPSIELLRSRGIHPDAGDITGRPTVRGAQELGAQPGGGGSYEAVKSPPIRQLTAAVTEDMGHPVPRVVPDAPGAPGTIRQTADRLGAVFENTARKLPITYDQRLDRDLGRIITELAREGFTDAQVHRVYQQIENVINGFVTRTARGAARPRGIMSGDTYQSLTRYDTPLGAAMRDSDANVRRYARQVRTALDNAMERTVDVAVRNAFRRGKAGGPAQARANELATAQEQLRDARRQWYVKEIVQDAVSRPGGEGGVITPKNLRAALVKGKENRKAYAVAQSRLQQLSHAANEIMTTERSLDFSSRARWQGVAGGVLGSIGGPIGTAGGAAAGFMAPGMIGRMLNSPRGQRWLTAQRGPNPPSVQMLVDATRGIWQARPEQKREPLRLTVRNAPYGGTDSD